MADKDCSKSGMPLLFVGNCPPLLKKVEPWNCETFISDKECSHKYIWQHEFENPLQAIQAIDGQYSSVIEIFEK